MRIMLCVVLLCFVAAIPANAVGLPIEDGGLVWVAPTDGSPGFLGGLLAAPIPMLDRLSQDASDVLRIGVVGTSTSGLNTSGIHLYPALALKLDLSSNGAVYAGAVLLPTTAYLTGIFVGVDVLKLFGS